MLSVMLVIALLVIARALKKHHIGWKPRFPQAHQPVVKKPQIRATYGRFGPRPQ